MEITDKGVAEEVINMLDDVLIKGMMPHEKILTELRFDIRYLSEVFEKLKKVLPNAPGFHLIQDTEHTRGHKGEWSEVVAWASGGYKDVECLRLAHPPTDNAWRDNYRRSLLSLHPINSGTYYVVELFLTKDMNWIVYHDRSMPGQGSFESFSSIEDLCQHMDELAGETHRFGTYPQNKYAYIIADHLMGLAEEVIQEAEIVLGYTKSQVRGCEAMTKRVRGDRPAE